MLLLGLDFETTGLDPEADRIIEVGAVLWDTTRGVPLRIYSELLREHGDPHALSAEIEGLTGITTSDWLEYGKGRLGALDHLAEMAEDAEAIVAHNAPFDRAFLVAALRRRPEVTFPERPWIDTLLDVPWPERLTSRKLVHLCAEHGFLNPFAHRAVTDVLAMLRLLREYDITEVFARSQQPDVTLVARVDFKTNALAKARRFRWQPASRTWAKTVKEGDVEKEIALAQRAGFVAAIVPDLAAVV